MAVYELAGLEIIAGLLRAVAASEAFDMAAGAGGFAGLGIEGAVVDVAPEALGVEVRDAV